MSPSETRAYYQDHPNARYVALVVVCIGSALNPLMLSSVTVAVPAIAQALSGTAVQVAWLPTAFMLATAVLLVPFGKLSDMFGRKRVYLGGLASMVLGGLVAGTAQSMEVLLLGRLIQGGAAAMIFGTGMAILTAIWPAERLGFALGTAASCIYVGLTVGPWFGGAVTALAGWRWVFFAQVPVYLSVIAATLTFLKGEWKQDERPRFDFIGAALYVVAIVTLVLGLTSLPSRSGGAMLAVGLLLCVWFFKDQARRPEPLVRVTAVAANRVFLFSLLASFVSYAGTFPIMFLMSLYLQYIGGLGPGAAGTVLLAQALTTAVCVPFAGRLADAMEPRIIATIGCLIVLAGVLWLRQLGFGSPIWIVVVGQMTVGLGLACFGTPNSSAAMRSLRTGNLGIASALVNLARTLGNILGMSIVMLAVTVFIGSGREIAPEGYPGLLRAIHLSLLLSASFALVAAVLSWRRGTLVKQLAGGSA